MTDKNNGLNPAGKKRIGVMSVDTTILAQRLQRVNPGEIVTYDELSNLIRRNVAGPARPVANAAIRSLLPSGYVFACINRTGYRRLTDEEIVLDGAEARARLRRAASRATKKLLQVKNFNDLSEESKVAHNASLTTLAAIAHIVAPATQSRVESAVRSANGMLSVQHALQAFAPTGAITGGATPE